jgi:hypothetical protein
MAGQEVSVQVCQEDVLDCEMVLLGKGQIVIDVTLRIHHSGGTGPLVTDEVGCMSEAVQVELVEKHEVNYRRM